MILDFDLTILETWNSNYEETNEVLTYKIVDALENVHDSPFYAGT